MDEPYIIKIENTVLRLYQENGVFERVICAGAQDAEIKGDEIIVHMKGGNKKIYSIRGFFKRSV
ncbi:MAG: hypothetical protein WBM07_13485 [Chitinivibrionales bacterium]